MAKFLTSLDRLLRRLYPGSETELEAESPRGKVGGFVVWKGFRGMDIERRTMQLYESLRRELDEKDLRKVSLIMPLTPREMAFRKEEMARPEAQVESDLAGHAKHG